MAFRNLLFLAASTAASGFLALGTAQPAHANLVVNGGFAQNSISGSFGSSFLNGTQGVTIDDWTVSTSFSFLVADGNAISTNINQTNNGPDPVFGTPITGFNGFPLALYSPGQSVSSPTGSGWFVATNGSYGADALFSQTVTGFNVGEQYVLSFYSAGGQQQGFTGNATSFWKAFIGGQEISPAPSVINVPDLAPVSPWFQYVSDPFTASSPSLLLSLKADGAPSGNSPFALLAGVAIEPFGTPPPPPQPVPGPLPALGAGMALVWSRKLRRRIAGSANRVAGADS